MWWCFSSSQSEVEARERGTHSRRSWSSVGNGLGACSECQQPTAFCCCEFEDPREEGWSSLTWTPEFLGCLGGGSPRKQSRRGAGATAVVAGGRRSQHQRRNNADLTRLSGPTSWSGGRGQKTRVGEGKMGSRIHDMGGRLVAVGVAEEGRWGSCGRPNKKMTMEVGGLVVARKASRRWDLFLKPDVGGWDQCGV
jgi:hypothetical protein